MVSTFSPNLRIELIATGEQSGSWGDTTNINLGAVLEQAIGGVVSVAHNNTDTFTLTTVDGGVDQARSMTVVVTGTLTADRPVIVPSVNKLYVFRNSTTGGFNITPQPSGGTGPAIGPGESRVLYTDGTNAVVAEDGVVPLTRGGTGATTAADARTALGLGSIATQDASAIAITGGTMDGVTITGGSIAGDGSSLTNVNASQLDGLSSSQFLRSDTSDTMSGNLVVTGSVTANTFSGNGASVTNVNASTLGGISSGNFVRSDTSDTMNGTYTITGDLTVSGGDITVGQNGGGDSDIHFYDDNSNTTRTLRWDDSANFFSAEDNSGTFWPIAMFSTSSSNTTTSFPVGQVVMVGTGGTLINTGASYTVRNPGGSGYSNSSGSVMSGTWRARGSISVNDSNRLHLTQRVA